VLRAILFGFNGILVDDESIHRALFARVLGEEGVAWDEEDRRPLALDDRRSFAAALAAAGEAADPPRVARLVARKASYYRERMRRDGYPFFPGAVALVTAVAARGLMLGVVSGAQREEVEGALAQEGLRQCFKVLITAEDMAARKPDPPAYRQAIEALNSRPPLPERLLHPHEALAVEDGPAGIAAAADAGLSTLGIAHTYPAAELAGADLVSPAIAAVSFDELRDRFAA
jgi:HAD superfamily hydrolase (TIGR01509 family)